MSEGGISSAGGDTAKTNLIVNYLPQTMTEKDLYAMFMTIGPIESCRVMKDFKVSIFMISIYNKTVKIFCLYI